MNIAGFVMNKIHIYHTSEAEFCCNFTLEVFCTLTLFSVCDVIKIKGKVLFMLLTVSCPGDSVVQFICLQQCSEKEM
jgi:hypothetical protein